MSDPYLKEKNAVERLLKEYRKHPRLIVAVDFDDTVFDYHGGGDNHERVLQLLRECKKHNFYIVVWTASDPSRFDEMKLFLSDRGIKIDSINENPIPLPFGNHKKIYYNILLDDRAGLRSAVDTLETLLFLIDNEPKTEYSEKQGSSNFSCNKVRQRENIPYPRTCVECGLGPCKELYI
jgi:hypothetical protein